MTEWRASADLPAAFEAPATGRGFVAAVLPAWGLTALVEDARLVVSELVSNALRHAAGPASFHLELDGRVGGVRISLADGSSIPPVVAQLAHDAPSGRGLRIVEHLARAWGADIDGTGKRVWAELEVPADQAPSD